MHEGILYIVSTPIGNLEDITLRSLRILKEVDIIAAEDTRHSLKLLNHYGIKKPLISYWSEKEKVRADELIQKLLSGMSVALISDAGTPGISDPAAVLIKRAIEENIQIIPIPGASAVIAALSASGLNTDEFTFIGFLPPKQAHRRKKLLDLSFEPRTLVFYEAPHRIHETLADIETVIPGRKAAVAREITKKYEEIMRGELSEIVSAMKDKTSAGEYVIIVEGRQDEEKGFDEALLEVQLLMRKGMGRKEAVNSVASQYGISKKELYDKSLGH